MNILFVSNSYRPYQGGVVQSIEAIMQELLSQGHTVNLVTLSFHLYFSRNTFHIPSWFIFNYKNNPIPCAKFPSYYLEKYVNELKPDIIHVQHPFFLGPKICAIARKKNIPVVFTYHTQYEEYISHMPQIAKLMIRAYVDRFCKQVNGIIFPSHAIKKKCGYNASSIILPSPIKDDFFAKPYAFKKLEFPVRLLYVGRLVPEKNITFLLEVMRLLDDRYQLRIVGYGFYIDYLKDYAYTKLRLTTAQVRFIENPSRQELLQEYEQAHLFLFASKTETQALVLAEAMAHGLPIIAWRSPGAAGALDIIGHGANGYLVDGCQEMANTIISINSANYFQLSYEAHQVAQQYKPQRICRQLAGWYTDIINRARLTN